MPVESCCHEVQQSLIAVHFRCVSCPAGSMLVNGEVLSTRDAARIKGGDDSSTQLNLEAAADGAHFMLIEMAKSLD